VTDLELDAWLRLTLTPGVGNATARRLLARFGLPQQVFAQDAPALVTQVGPTLARALQTEPEGWRALCDTTREWLTSGRRRHVVTLGDPDYPQALLQTEDPPLLLHVLGDIALLQHPYRIAMVGSRNPTPQGLENARQFARALAAQGVCVVSGLALGVDGAAHEGALEAGGTTLAVVGTGLDRVYPRRHQALAHRIAEQGALLSEYPIGTPPMAAHFPQRNRLIAGLSHGTLVVEATLQSGSLITARLATEQGREVYAIPGSIHAPQSRGCHQLIRQGAKLVESAQDILEDLKPSIQPVLDAPQPGSANPDAPSDDPLLQALGYEPADLDALQARTGWPTAQLQARLLELELEGCVGRLSGGRFQRTGRA
jgi:DNA processing protein